MIDINDLNALPTPERIGRRVVAIRGLRKMTQAELAKKAGISNKTLVMIENAKTDCRLSVIGKIEAALQATLILVNNEDIIGK